MRPSKESFYQWNEIHAEKHDLDKFYNHPNRLFRYIENKRIKYLLNYAEIKETDMVLEVGCGSGIILEKINKGILHGIDISEIQIRRAERRLGSKARLIKCPAEELPFGDKEIDKIICTEVFEHTFEPPLILAEMRRVLKDKGLISLSIPNEKLINFTKKFFVAFGMRRVLEPKESNWDLASKNNLEEWHLHEYSLGMIKLQIRGLFKILSIKRIPFYFIPFRYVLKLGK